MPLPNEHAARQSDPDRFVKLWRETLDGGPDGLSVIYGIDQEGQRAIQSIRANAQKLSVEDFRRWLEDNGMKTDIKEATGEVEVLAEWTTAYVNDLPDSSFLYVAPGGEKDDDDKTKPRSLRYFPFKDAAGKVDLPHLRNAIGRIPQSTAPGLTKDKMRQLQEKSRNLLRAESEDKEEMGEDPKYSEVYCGAPYLLANGAQSWVEIVRSGKFYGNTGPNPRKVELTEDDIYSMARTYDQVMGEQWFSDGAPVGYNHAAAMGDRTPEATRAAARIQRVDVRPNDSGGLSLWGLFTWTDEGARRIEAEEFSSISAELLPPNAATSKATGAPMGGFVLVGATLTNAPFIPGMQAPALSGTLANSEPITRRIYLTEAAPEPKENPQMSDIIVKLAEATGLPAEAPELMAEVRRLQEEAAKVIVLTETLETATKEVETLRTRNVLLEDREKTRTLDTACAIGRIAPTEREQFWKVMETLGEEDTHRLFAEGRVPVGRESSEQAASDAAPADAVDAFVALMDRFMSEGKTETEAWQLAAQANGSTLYVEEN
jgi:hypothetical protein